MAKDRNIADSLWKTVCDIAGGDRAVLVATDDDWRRVRSCRPFLGLIDAKLIGEDILDVLLSFERLVVFNRRGYEAKVDMLTGATSHQARTVLTIIDDSLTDRILRERFGQEMEEAEEIPPGFTPVRVSSVAEDSRQPLSTAETERHPEFDEYLNHLSAGLSQTLAGLTENFVSTPSRMRVPPPQQHLRTPPAELAEAEGKLRSFARNPESKGKGCFLVAKKGAGKSTLAYYVGRTDDRDGKLLCIAIDYTMEVQSSLQARLLPLLDCFMTHYKGSMETQVPGYPQTAVFKARRAVEKILQDERYDLVGDLTPAADALLGAESDRGYVIRLYLYYACAGANPDEAYSDYREFNQLVHKAEDWYDSLTENPKRLFALYLNFLLSYVSGEAFEDYSYGQIARYILTTEEHDPASVQAFERAFAEMDVSRFIRGPAELDTSRGLLSACQTLPPKQLREVVLSAMHNLVGDRPLLVLLDNLDQRMSPVLEARGIHDAIRLFNTQLYPSFPQARAIVAVRDKTFVCQAWVSRDPELSREWPTVQVAPPDFLSVLYKRTATWQRAGTHIAGASYPQATVIHGWISEMAESRRIRQATHDLLEIIENRHPFNVRDQLHAFTKCCENWLLHREWLKSFDKARKALYPWSERSFEFFLRVFLLGDCRYFNEAVCELPNLYDNGFPRSAYNACIRSWLLLTPRSSKEVLDGPELIGTFAEAGVPRREIEYAVSVLKRFRLFYPQPEEGTFVLSVWGEYFRKRVGFDLPYVSTVWWTTRMLERFNLGQPRELLASELRDFGAVFLRWLRLEETLARDSLSSTDFMPPEVFSKVSFSVSYSLHRIEKVL